jgi:uncharacterized protein YbbC (DUF1343 family)
MPTLPGLDVLRRDRFASLQGRCIGLLTNPSAVTYDLTSAYDVFRTATDITLSALFGPEHGFAAAIADGEKIGSSRDALTGLPVYSLYGETQRPTADMFNEIDVLVCDLQDIGTRFYTFAWTIMYALEAAGAAGLDICILDRPNPLGARIDGPLVEPGHETIVGGAPVPIQHGLTLGELAQMYNALWNPTPANLTVIRCENYQRGQAWKSTRLTFITPSPNMPTLTAAWHYPGSCLIEGTNLSEGRGTALPFEITGAPFIDGRLLTEHLNAQEEPGVRYRPHAFTPTAGKFAGQICYGVQSHITWQDYRALRAWVGVIMAARSLFPQDFAWREPHQPGGRPWIDTLAGGDTLRQQVERGDSLADIAAGWDEIAAKFKEDSRPFWLYAE